MEEPLLTLLGLAYLAAPLAAWLAWRRTRRLERAQADLLRRLAELEARLDARAAPDGLTAAAAAQASLATQAPVVAAPPVSVAPPGPSAAAPRRSAGLLRRRADLEAAIAQRWLVWLGGVALALGGIFLAGWALEQGWLGPPVRLGGATLLGLVLLALAERARPRATAVAAAATDAPPPPPDYVAPALAAGGLCSLYGAALAAHLLYALLGLTPAFLLLGLVSLLGVALGLRFGPLVALLGAAGAYLTPVFVTSADPSPWALFLFLGLVAPTLLLLMRAAGWPWLGWLAVAGAASWQLAALAAAAALAPAAQALHLALLGAGGLLARAWDPRQLEPARRHATDRPAALAAAVAGPLFLPLLDATGHAAPALLFLGLLSAATLALTAATSRACWLAALLAGVDLSAAAIWRIPPLMPRTELRDPSVGLDPLLWIAPEAAPLAWALALTAAAYAVPGYLLARRSGQPGFWAALSAAVPLAALAVGYWRLKGWAVSPGFATLALALAGLALLAAERMARREGRERALAAYAVAVVAALALGCAMALREGWLTVALALLLPAMAWVGRRLGLDELRRPAWVVLGLVVVRVLLEVPDWAGVPVWRPWHLLYLHGVPLAATWLAARLVRRHPRDPLATVLSAAALLFWVLLVTAQIEGAVRASTAAPAPGLVETAALGLAWLATALGLLRWRAADPGSRVARHGWPVLAALAGVAIGAGNLALTNPLVTGDPVGPWPILDLLLPAYGLPALLLALAARTMNEAGLPRAALGAGLLAQILGLVWLSLEVRHAFQGEVLTGPAGNAEWLAWSAAWLAWAGLFLGFGIRQGNRPLRAMALLVAGLAVAKVFLFDFAELAGLYRAASFLALGLCLVAVGWLYRRYVVAAATAA